MKKLKALAYAALGAYCLLSFAVFFSQVHAQLTQRWTRDAFQQVTATTTVATTDLRGTVTTGWDKVVVHNNSASVGVGAFPIYNRLGEAYGVDTFAEMTVYVPPNSSVPITDEDVIALATITAAGSAALIIERHEKP